MLILSGEGRRAFHGVPRIVHAHGVDELFGERETSDDEITAEEWDACHDFLASGARININVRQLFFEDGNTDVDVADEVRDPSRVVRGR